MFHPYIRALILPLFLASCGSGSEFVTLKIISPIGMNKKFHSLSEEIIPNLTMNPATCTQSNLMIGYKDLGTGIINGKKFSVQHSLPSIGYPLSNPSNILANATLLDPLTITVLKGRTIDVGMVGAVYDPIDALTINDQDVEISVTPDGICDSLASTGSTAGRSSYSVNGSNTITPGDVDSVIVKVGVATANPTAFATPNPPSTPGNFVCPNVFSDIHECSINNYVSFNTSVAVNKAEVNYLFFTDGSPMLIRHQIKNTSFLHSIIPHFLPMRLIVDNLPYTLNDATLNGSIFNGTGGIVTYSKY